MSKLNKEILILGGGIAGLAAGYFLKQNRIPFKILEKDKSVGGLSKTYKRKGFRYDSGAHRIHSKIPESLDLVKKLLGKNLNQVRLPTQIYHNGKLLDFPLTPLNVIINMGPLKIGTALLEIIFSKLDGYKADNCQDIVVGKYGKTISSLFLLNHMKKLWGLGCENLLPEVAGTRLAGMNLKTFILELLLGPSAKTEHIEGSFFYPKYGIGMLSEAFLKKIGKDKVYLNSNVIKIIHAQNIIKSIEVESGKKIKNMELGTLISTIPITLFVRALRPSAPKSIIKHLDKITFRNLKVVTLFLNREKVSNASTITFPDEKIPFSRMYEPKNRSRFMAPGGKTSVMVEIPYNEGDKIQYLTNKKLVQNTVDSLVSMKFISKEDVLDSVVFDIKEAYPVPSISSIESMKKITTYLRTFKNLHLLGRNGLFKYSHIHHQIRDAKYLVEKFF